MLSSAKGSESITPLPPLLAAYNPMRKEKHTWTNYLTISKVKEIV